MDRGFGFRELVERRMRSLRPPPLLAPLERFLSSSSRGEICLSAVKGEETAVNPSGPSVIDHFSSAIGVPPSGILLNESSFFGALLVGNGEEAVRRESSRGGAKKAQSSSSSSSATTVHAKNVVKGQWTAGRSENSIKNHWNATKRRQNAKRRSKRKTGSRGGKPEPSILQDYIRSKTTSNLKDNCTGKNNTPNLIPSTATYGVYGAMKQPMETILDHPVNSESVKFGAYHVGNMHDPCIHDSLDDAYYLWGIDDCMLMASPPSLDLVYHEEVKGEVYEIGRDQDKYSSEPYVLHEEHATPGCVFAAEGDEFFFKDQTSSSSKGDMDLMEMISWQMSQSRSQSSSCNGSF